MFYGREYYLGLLAELLDKPTASVVTCRGRRRIGKSTLFEEFARRNRCRFLKLEGLTPDETIGDLAQRTAFGRQLAEQTTLPRLVPEDWLQAFQLLDSAIRDDEWTVVLLDEISWMGSRAADFPGDLKIAWDNRFRKHDRLILVLCGSVSSWITENIINSTGFVGRRTYDFVLPELPLRDAVRFWGESLERRSSREVLDILSLTGGVPRYLEEMNFALSAEENARRQFFRPEGYLFQDFHAIFDRVLGRKKERCRRILEALAEGPLTVSEIARALDITRSGYLSQDIRNLDASGFIAEEQGVNPETGEKALQTRYRIKDCYSRFHLRYVQPEGERIAKGLFDGAALAQTPGWDSLMGLQFETLVVNNFRDLLPPLGLEGVEIRSAAPYVKRGRKGEGCQIDLLIQTDRMAYVVEVKRRREIGMEVVEEMRRKVARIPFRKGVSTRTVLVYEGELSAQAIRAHAFDFLVPASRLIGR